MKGIILAAGKGTRLYPASLPVSKILLPVYDKPMIYYPLSTLISAGVNDVLIITSEEDQPNFIKLLGDGSQFGISISYEIQYVAKGIADALIIGEEFIAGEPFVLILGDNLFYGSEVATCIVNAINNNQGATIFYHEVENPSIFGVVEIDSAGKVISLEEKPEVPKSNMAAVGIYVYGSEAVSYAKQLVPSKRGELEITDLNIKYLEKGFLQAVGFPNDTEWVDTGSFESMLEASCLIHNIQSNQDILIGSPEYESVKRRYLSLDDLKGRLESIKQTAYYEWLFKHLL